MYNCDNKTKTKVWIKATKRLSGISKIKINMLGKTKFEYGGYKCVKVSITFSSENMFAKRRIPKVNGLMRLLINSIEKISGAIHQMGPAKCLRCPKIPFSLIPM